MNLLHKIGKGFHFLRRSQSLTQPEFCQKVDINLRHYQNIEAGKVDIRVGMLEKILNFYELDQKTFFTLIEDPKLLDTELESGLQSHDKAINLVKTKTAYFWVEDGILFAEALKNSKQTLPDAIASTAAHIEVSGNTPLPLLTDLTKMRSMDSNCRKHYAGEEHGKTYLACALVVSSMISKTIGNFFMTVNKPVKPTRLFNSKEDALKWLTEFQN